jgi:hypothetical protein
MLALTAQEKTYPDMAAAREDAAAFLAHRFGTAILPPIPGKTSPEIAAWFVNAALGIMHIANLLRVVDTSSLPDLGPVRGHEGQDTTMQESREIDPVVAKREPRSSNESKSLVARREASPSTYGLVDEDGTCSNFYARPLADFTQSFKPEPL